jgi:Tol biopolymer transport system component
LGVPLDRFLLLVVGGSLGSGRLTVWDWNAEKELLQWAGRVFNPPGFSADGKRLVVLFQDNTVRGWKVDSGTEIFPTRTLRPPSGLPAHETLSPDGRWVAFTTRMRETTTVHVQDLEMGTERTWPSGHVGSCTAR